MGQGEEDPGAPAYAWGGTPLHVPTPPRFHYNLPARTQGDTFGAWASVTLVAEYKARSGMPLLQPAWDDTLMMTPLPLEQGMALEGVTAPGEKGRGDCPSLGRSPTLKGLGDGRLAPGMVLHAHNPSSPEAESGG